MATPIVPVAVKDEGNRKSRKKPEKKKPVTVHHNQSPIEVVDVENSNDLLPHLNRSFSCKGTSSADAISVEQYEEERELRLGLWASFIQSRPDSFIDLSLDNQDDSDDELRLLGFKPTHTPFGRRKKPSFSETGEASTSKPKTDPPTFVCEICIEPKPANESFTIKYCSHSYCTDCVAKYVVSKLQENATSIRCPVIDCPGILEPAYCRSILPSEALDRWGNALCEAVILGSEKFYCPYKDCSALLLDDGSEVVRESECPLCRRLFCAQCKVSWHTGIDCVEFQKLNKDEREREDIMLMELAQEKKWPRCPNCKFYVEKSAGCLFMKCRCGTKFCYRCGTATKIDHICNRCHPQHN